MPMLTTRSMPLAERQLEGGGLARYEQPLEQIRDLITGYHLYSAPRGQTRNDWFLPGTANIRISWHNKPIRVTIGDRLFDPVPQAALYGPTSRAMNAKTRGGIMVGIGVSAIGWSRLFRQTADEIANAIVPLDTYLPSADVAALTNILRNHDVANPIAPLLDSFLEPRLREQHRDEPHIARLAALIVSEDILEVREIVQAMGLEPVRVRRMAYRHFGFSPKQLLQRARFLRSIVSVVQSGPASASATIAASYCDQSHFIREAHRFLGMTPGQFADLMKPFLSASLELRPQVLGAATQALQLVGHRTTMDNRFVRKHQSS